MRLPGWIRWLLLVIFVIGSIFVVAVEVNLIPSEQVSPDVQNAAKFILVFTGPLGILLPLWGWLKPGGEAKADDYRPVLIRIARRDWIDGVLADALRDAQFDVQVETRPEQAGGSVAYADYRLPASSLPPASPPAAGLLGSLIRAVLRTDKTATPIATTPDALAQAFADLDGKLLILGAPGSGKSVLLLQLAARLLTDAEQNAMRPIPVVVNLSSWAVKRGPLNVWLADELRRGYGMRGKLPEQLIATDKLIYLLDGLDEVAEQHRAACLDAINAFLTPERRLAVCSRSDEYDALVDKLNVHQAVEVQPLNLPDFERILRRHIPHPDTVNALLATLNADPDLREEALKPLFANILISTYRDGRPFQAALAGGDTLARARRLLIEPYVTRQLQHAPVNAPYSNADTRRYLSWLGGQMRRHERTTFYVEELQGDWLTMRHWRGLDILFVVRLRTGPIYLNLNLNRKVTFKLKRLVVNLFKGPLVGAVLGFAIGLVGVLITLFAFGVREAMVAMLIGGVGVGLAAGLVSGVGEFRW